MVVGTLLSAPAAASARRHAEDADEPGAVVPARATVLSAVRVAVVNGRVQVILHGNGRLEARGVEFARDLPARLFVDFEGVDFTVPAATRVDRGDVRRIRVAANSLSPRVTRVVIDLSRVTRYDVSAGTAGDLVISIGEQTVASPPVESRQPATPRPPSSGGGIAPALRPVSAAARDVANTLAGPASTPTRATSLSGVRVEVVAGRVEVRLRANGRLEPSRVEYASDLPPRLVLDFPGVRSNVAPVARVARGDVRNVRIAANSLTPLVTRVVLDLTRQVPFRLEHRSAGGHELVITLSDEPGNLIAFGEPPGVDHARGEDVAALQARDEHASKGQKSEDQNRDDRGSEPVAATPASPVAVDAPAEAPSPASAPPEGDEAPTASPAPLQWAVQAASPAGSGDTNAGAPGRDERRSRLDGNQRRGTGPRLVQLRSLRAALGVGYDLIGSRVEDRSVVAYEDSMTSPLLTVQGGISIVDPRFLAIDGWADLRFNWRAYTSDVLDSNTHDTLQNYRVNFLVLSGKPAPLNIYVQRVDLFLDQRQNVQPAASFLELSQSGVQTTRGFSWDVNGRRLPHIVATGDITDRSDAGSFLAGWDSKSRQERLEVRADRSVKRTNYEVSYSHERSKYDYQLAQISTDYAIDFLRGTASTTVRPGLTVDGGARLTRYGFTGTDLLQRQRDLVSAGGFAGMQWQWSPRWRAGARYNATSNESDIGLAPGDTSDSAAGTDVSELSMRRRFLYQDFDTRVSYTPGNGGTVASVFARGVSLDPVAFVAPTLSTLRMVGIQADAGRSTGRFDMSVGGEAAAGQAASNRGDTQPYREAGARARLGTRFSRGAISATGGLRWNNGSYFYPVGGEAWHGTIEASADVASQLRLRGSASRSFLMRDVIFQRSDDRTDAYSLGVSGPRYELVVDYGNTQSTAAGLLETTLLLEPRPDLALAARPELFGFLYGSGQVLRGANIRVTILNGIDVFGRGRADHIDRPGLVADSDLDQTVAQLSVLWNVRQLRVEVAWEYLDSRTALVSTTNRRFYVRVRRDFPLF